MTNEWLNSALIIDDDPIACELARFYFHQRGTPRISVAYNGKQALEIVEQSDNPIDFILLDLKMPEMDGIQFLRRMHLRSFSGTIGILSGESAGVISLAMDLARKHGLNVIGPLAKPMKAGVLDALFTAPQKVIHTTANSKSFKPTASDLDAALAQHRIIAYYQPIIRADTDELAGVEALARWDHPFQGVIAPYLFIPLAERSGQMRELTLQMISTVLHDIDLLNTLHPELAVSINLGAAVLEDTCFPDIIAKLVAEAGQTNDRFILEITESKLIDDAIAPMEVMARLNLMGFNLSLDDFGTQYSNFEQLTRFPFKELKIDKRFVQSSNTDVRSKATFETCAQLGKRLGMRIVAEGIETDQDWQFAKDLGVDKLQGYRFARPMPVSELTSWAATRNLDPVRIEVQELVAANHFANQHQGS
ncbi:MAG: EAL domain-containing protein [Alphaproteobacteria bacterium]|nr:EAL domain-containing protein [Alphaproteobacteria bacterium]